jgi:mycothiol synthase
VSVPITLTTPAELDRQTAALVREFADQVEARDGQPPLSDHARTHLTSASVRHTLAQSGDGFEGYGQLDGPNGEVVGTADGSAAILTVWGPSVETVWSHGMRSDLIPVLESHGFRRERTLHQLRRKGSEVVEPVDLPSGVTIEPFRVGTDEDAWLRTNTAAFAHHPEQGRVQRADLDALIAEPWFDPAGFLLAWRGDQLLGYHWTKIHADGTGEVYVLGIDPAAQGLGLGKVLLSAGLEHLADSGCPEVLLYVDDSNTGAMRLYESVGFTRYDADIQWVR